MKTWQAILLHFALTIGASIVPTIKNSTVQTAVAAAVIAGTAITAQKNSTTDASGNTYPPANVLGPAPAVKP